MANVAKNIPKRTIGVVFDTDVAEAIEAHALATRERRNGLIQRVMIDYLMSKGAWPPERKAKEKGRSKAPASSPGALAKPFLRLLLSVYGRCVSRHRRADIDQRAALLNRLPPPGNRPEPVGRLFVGDLAEIERIPLPWSVMPPRSRWCGEWLRPSRNAFRLSITSARLRHYWLKVAHARLIERANEGWQGVCAVFSAEASSRVLASAVLWICERVAGIAAKLS
jgi:hypothetical protein